MKKVAAFTVMELLVVAILSLLIAATAFTAISILNKQYRSYETDNRRSAAFNEIYSWLQWDCNNSTRMKIDNEHLVFEYADKTISYHFTQDSIKRWLVSENKLLLQNTIKHKNLYTSFRNEQKEMGLIDHFQIDLNLFDKPTQLILSKEYSAKELISINGH